MDSGLVDHLPPEPSRTATLQHRLVALSDLSSSKLRPPPALIEGLILSRTLVQIAAAPYVGKSLLMQAIMLALDTGLPLMGKFPVPKRCSSLYLAFDAREWDYVQQNAKLRRGLSLSPSESAQLTSYFKFKQPKWKLTSLEVRQHLKDLYGELGFGVLFLDTFRRFHTLNQNDDRDMAAFMELLMEVQRDCGNCTIIFSNHTRKPVFGPAADPNYEARGSTEISAAVDFNLVLRRKGSAIHLELPKGRGAATDDLDSVAFTLTYGGTTDEPSVTLSPHSTPEAHSLVREAAQGVGGNEVARSELVAWLGAKGHVHPERLVTTGLQWLKRHDQAIQIKQGTWRIK